MAAKHFAVVANDPKADPTLKEMNAALMASADGDWARASEVLTRMVEEDAENYVVSWPHMLP
jgi:trafficking protein particle complex subunit 12